MYFVEKYRIYCMYLDRQARAKSVDSDEMLQNVASHHGLHCLPLVNNILNTLAGSGTDSYKF